MHVCFSIMVMVSKEYIAAYTHFIKCKTRVVNVYLHFQGRPVIFTVLIQPIFFYFLNRRKAFAECVCLMTNKHERFWCIARPVRSWTIIFIKINLKKKCHYHYYRISSLRSCIVLFSRRMIIFSRSELTAFFDYFFNISYLAYKT